MCVGVQCGVGCNQARHLTRKWAATKIVMSHAMWASSRPNLPDCSSTLLIYFTHLLTHPRRAYEDTHECFCFSTATLSGRRQYFCLGCLFRELHELLVWFWSPGKTFPSDAWRVKTFPWKWQEQLEQRSSYLHSSPHPPPPGIERVQPTAPSVFLCWRNKSNIKNPLMKSFKTTCWGPESLTVNICFCSGTHFCNSYMHWRLENEGVSAYGLWLDPRDPLYPLPTPLL